MTSKFAEAAIKYVKETDYIDDLNRNLAGNAFIAGAEHGYSEGLKTRQVVEMTEDEVKLRKEVFQLKQQIAEREETNRQVTTELVRTVARLEECEKLLDEAQDSICSHEPEALEVWRSGKVGRSWCCNCSSYIRSDEQANLVERVESYFAKHSPDSAGESK